MIDKILDILRKKLKQMNKISQLLYAGKSYADDNSYAWTDLDGDEFEDGSAYRIELSN